MKKLAVLTLSLLMVLTMLAGCSSGGDATSTEPAGGGDSAPAVASDPGGGEAPDGEDPYEIVIELVNYGMDIPDLGVIEAAVNEYIQPKINSTIKFATVPVSEQFMKLNLWVAGNEKIDLAMTGITTNPSNLVGQGVLLPITELVTGSEVLMGMAEDYLPACTIEGEIYAFPGILYPAIGTLYMYDKQLADEYNIEIPEQLDTIEDLEPYLEQVKASGMERYPISFGNGDAATMNNMPNTFDEMTDTRYHTGGGIMLNGDAETIVNVYATDEYREMLHRHRDWFDKGLVEPTAYSNGYDVNAAMTAELTFGILLSESVGSNLAYWSATNGREMAGCSIGGKRISGGGITNMSWGIPVTCERPEKVIEFMELLFTDGELATLLNYGIEGKHYEKVDGTENIIDYPEGLTGFTSGYGTFINWYGDTKMTYQRVPNTDSFYDTLNDYTLEGGAKVMPSFGYTFDSTPVTTESSALVNVVTEYRDVLECGLVEDVDAQLDEFLVALEQAGIDNVIAENQAQFDAWKASKA